MQRLGEAEARQFAKGPYKNKSVRVSPDVPAPARGLTLGEAVLSYYEQQGTRQESEHAIKADYTRLMRLVESIGDNTPLAEIDLELIRKVMALRRLEFRYGRVKHGLLSEVYVWEIVPGLLKRLMSYHSKHAPDIDWKKVPRPENVRTREVSFAEEAALEPFQADGYRDCFDFGILSALRKTNLTRVQWSQVDFEAPNLKVRMKGRKVRNIPLTKAMVAILRDQEGNHSTAVFTYVARRTGKIPRTDRYIVKGNRYPMTGPAFAQYVKGLQKKFGGTDPFTIHDLRRTAACRTLRSAGLKPAQELLGHTSPVTTARAYAFLGEAALLESMEATQQQSRNIRAKIAVENKA